MNVGNRIKLARKAAGLTQKQLADRLGISPVNISQLENNARAPKFETLKRIAEALGTTPRDMVYYDSDIARRHLESIDASDFESEEQYRRALRLLESLADIEQQLEFGLSNVDDETIDLLPPLQRKSRILSALDLLTEAGQIKAVERVEELTEIPKYRRDAQEQTDPPAPADADRDD